MALYTPLDDTALARVSAAWHLGPVRQAVPIPQGSINTNYRLVTDAGLLFLRHTTVRSEADLTYEAALLGHLREHRLSVPQPLPRADGGGPFLPLLGGRVSLFSWLAGEERTRAELAPAHLLELGRELGRVHRASASFAGRRDNPYGPATVRAWVEGLLGHADPTLAQAAGELARTLDALEARPPELEPRGAIHADLFLDNVKWLGERLSALLDFEMACHEAYALDVAITLNAWCFEAGAYRADLARALLEGYEAERPLGAEGRRALYHHARYGAVRFTASRIRDYHLSGLPPDRLVMKDWRTYLARVRTLAALGERGFLSLLGAA
jgi:homoserine kinase type II